MFSLKIVPPIPQIHTEFTFQRKDLLPLRSAQLWKVESGFLRLLTWDEEGVITTLGFWAKGELIGLALSEDKPYQMECLSAVRVSQLPPDSQSLQTAVLTYAQRMESLLSIMHSRSLTCRLVKFLDWLSSYYGRPIPEGRILELRLTHQLIAETLGTARVSVTRLMNQFELDGKIQRLRLGQLIIT
jgi:CRP-like cAMP-binding protein